MFGIPRKEQENALVMHDCGESWAVLKQAIGWPNGHRGHGTGFLVVTKAGKGKRKHLEFCETREKADSLMRKFSEGI